MIAWQDIKVRVSLSVCHAKQSTRIHGMLRLSLATPADSAAAVIERLLSTVVPDTAPKVPHSYCDSSSLSCLLTCGVAQSCSIPWRLLQVAQSPQLLPLHQDGHNTALCCL